MASAPTAGGRRWHPSNGYTVGVSRFSTHPLWERHPAGDEFLQVFEGELDITLLTPEGPVESTLRRGVISVVPKGLWHVAAARDGDAALCREGEGHRSLERESSGIESVGQVSTRPRLRWIRAKPKQAGDWVRRRTSRFSGPAARVAPSPVAERGREADQAGAGGRVIESRA